MEEEEAAINGCSGEWKDVCVYGGEDEEEEEEDNLGANRTTASTPPPSLPEPPVMPALPAEEDDEEEYEGGKVADAAADAWEPRVAEREDVSRADERVGGKGGDVGKEEEGDEEEEEGCV